MNSEVAGSGTVLADAMGLGKTLQCIALIWALLKHGPYGNKPVLRRVIIVTPGTSPYFVMDIYDLDEDTAAGEWVLDLLT